MKKFLVLIVSFLFASNIVHANEKIAVKDYTPNSKSSILVEASTGNILFEKSSHEKLPPASMTKIATLLLISEALEDKKISLNDKVMVSENAASMGGSQIFIEAGSEIILSDLLKGVGIASANDASVALAEHIGGSEENFVNMMNDRARELGAKNTSFKNPHGLDEKDHYTTAYDLSLIARELVKHEEILKITSTYEEYINIDDKNHWLVNTNSLVRFYNGIDGLKTGYTDKAKYCLTATMKKNDMRLLSVVMGVDTKEKRNTDTISLMEYGYSMYGIKNVVNSEKALGKIALLKSKNKYIDYYLEEDVNILVDKNTRNIEYEIKKDIKTLPAPLKNGDVVGKLTLKYNNKEINYNLIIKKDIEKLNYIGLLYQNLKEIISGNVNIRI